MEKNPKTILQTFTIEDWQDWIEDILTIGIANPISSLSDDDVLKDIVEYLIQNNIPPKNYEIALSKTLDRFYGYKNYETKVYRILDVFIILKSQRTKDILFKLFLSSNANINDDFYFNIRLKTLQSLYRLELSTSERKIIEESFYLTDISSFKNKPSYFGYYLRFFRLQKDIKSFFSALTQIISQIELGEGETNLIKRHSLVLFEKVEEIYIYHQPIFFSNFFDWLINLKEETFDKPLFKAFLSRMNVFLSDEAVVKQLKGHFSKELKYGTASALVVFSLIESITLKEFSLNTWIQAIEFIIKKNDFEYINKVFTRSYLYITKHFTPIENEIIYRNNLGKMESIIVNEQIFDLIDKTINLACIPTQVNKDTFQKNSVEVMEDVLSEFNYI